MYRKTNVLFAVSSLCNAGAETQALDLINGLDNTKFNKSLVIFKDREEQLEKLDSGNIELFRLFRKFKLDFLIIFRLATIIRNQNIDVIHATNQFCMLLAWLASFLVKKRPKIVVALHTTVNVNSKDELLDRFLYRRVLSACDKILFVCQTQKDHWLGKFPEICGKSVVVYNGVDEEFYSRAKVSLESDKLQEELGLSSIGLKNPFVVSCIAGFRPEKAHDILVEAFEKLPPETVLLLAGEGPRRTQIESLVRMKGLGSRVIFLGNLNDVRPLLLFTNVTVLASTAVETFSIAMLESMAMQVPMIATDIGGLKEAIVPGVTGELVPVGDVDALANTLARLSADSRRVGAMGVAARKSVEQRFTKSGMIQATEQFLLINEKASSDGNRNDR